MKGWFSILPALFLCSQVWAQTGPVKDSLMDTGWAREFVKDASRNKDLWKNQKDDLKKAFSVLLDHMEEPFDSTRQRLLREDFGSVKVSAGTPMLVDSIKISWINDTTFVVDPHGWNRDLYIKQGEKLVYPVDFSTLVLSDSLLDENGMLDSALFTPDTVHFQVIDTSALESLEIAMYSIKRGRITPPLSDPEGKRMLQFSADSLWVEAYIPDSTWIASDSSRFRVLPNEHYLDSLEFAVARLLDYMDMRDSTRILINDIHGNKSPFWLSSGKEETLRFWVKNYHNDSITLWVGNPEKNEISLVLEDEVSFSRLEKEEINYLPLFLKSPDRNLNEMKMLEPAPVYWDYEINSIFSLNQSFFSNWTKGGESSFVALMDITGKATYNNKAANSQWINTGRLKFGTISSEEKGFRKNQDLFEIDSRYNRNAWGTIGMSASFYMKQQLAKGYNYPNDSVPVSKFLNPGSITIGLGAEYKPFKNTTLNVAPLSYKTTFVLDTANIDQTKHGIDEDKRSKRELGTQIVVFNKINPIKELEITNHVRLFSNYLNHPENIDVDWELIAEQKINWFFTIRLNLHLIYDDNIKFPVLDDNNQPVLLPDGSKKQAAKAQFKEFIGLSLQFKF